MKIFDTISHAYHVMIAKDRANEEGIVVNPPNLGNRPGEGKVTYSSEVNDVLIPYTTREDTYNYYEVRNYVNDVNQENTQVLKTYDDQMKFRETYTYGNERISYMNHQTKEEYEYLTDARGSVTGLTKDDEKENTNSYGVYGAPEEVDDTGNPYGYTGEAQDVTGYNYLRARYYDSQGGTFLTQDSYEGEADNPLSQNGYTYVENNPVNYSDPTGHKKKSLWSTVSKILKPFYNTAKKLLPILNYFEPIVAPVIKYVKPVVNNFVPNVVNSFFGKPINPPTNLVSSGVAYVKFSQQAAAQTIFRQQQINNQYAQATANKGAKKINEADNILRNGGKALFETLTKFCKTAPKAKKAQTAKEMEKEQLEAAFGKAKNGKYFVSWVGPGGQGVWMDHKAAKEYYNSIHNKSGKQIAKEIVQRVWSALFAIPSSVKTPFSMLQKLVAEGGAKIVTTASGELILNLNGTKVVVGAAGLVIAASQNGWGDPKTLDRHFKDHGKDFKSKNKEEYTKEANDFYKNRRKYQVKVDEDGVIRVYDPKTNRFGSYNKDGTTKTYFKPTCQQAYFDGQPGK